MMQAIPSKPSQTSVNLSEIQSIINILVKSLIDQPFNWLSVAYGDEIHLYFGKENITTLKSGRVQKKSDWILNTSSSLWTLEKDNQIILTSEIFELNQNAENFGYVRLEKEFQLLNHRKLCSFEMVNSDFVTVLRFEENYVFTLIPNLKINTLPYWELFMPTEQVLIIEGKSPFWSCQSVHDRY